MLHQSSQVTEITPQPCPQDKEMLRNNERTTYITHYPVFHMFIQGVIWEAYYVLYYEA